MKGGTHRVEYGGPFSEVLEKKWREIATRTGMPNGCGDAQDQNFWLEKHFPDAGFLSNGISGDRHLLRDGASRRFRGRVAIAIRFLADRRPFRFCHRGDGQSRHDQSNHAADVVRHSPSLWKKLYGYVVTKEQKSVHYCRIPNKSRTNRRVGT